MLAVRKGFTLIELIVVLIIIGLLAALAIPSFNAAIEQTKAQTAQNNLLAIAAAQQKYLEDNNFVGNYFSGSGPDFNAKFHLNISPSDPFQYSCGSGGGGGTGTGGGGGTGTGAATGMGYMGSGPGTGTGSFSPIPLCVASDQIVTLGLFNTSNGTGWGISCYGPNGSKSECPSNLQ